MVHRWFRVGISDPTVAGGSLVPTVRRRRLSGRTSRPAWPTIGRAPGPGLPAEPGEGGRDVLASARLVVGKAVMVSARTRGAYAADRQDGRWIASEAPGPATKARPAPGSHGRRRSCSGPGHPRRSHGRWCRDRPFLERVEAGRRAPRRSSPRLPSRGPCSRPRDRPEVRPDVVAEGDPGDHPPLVWARCVCISGPAGSPATNTPPRSAAGRRPDAPSRSATPYRPRPSPSGEPSGQRRGGSRDRFASARSTAGRRAPPPAGTGIHGEGSAPRMTSTPSAARPAASASELRGWSLELRRWRATIVVGTP